MFVNQTTTSPLDVHTQCQKAQESNTTLLQTLIDHHDLKIHNQLWYKGNALVVVGNNSLKRGVIQLFHDLPSAGHPGIANTRALINRDYWWPNMPQDVEEYVKGCVTCQANKVNTHRPKPRLFPITTNPEAEPFQVIAMDFIVKLPLFRGYDSILTITDHDCTKASIFIPCSVTEQRVDSYYTVMTHVSK